MICLIFRMDLIQQLVSYKLERSEEHFLNLRYSKGIWDFNCAYQLAKAFLQSSSPNKRIKNILWRNFLRNISKKDNYFYLMQYIQKDFEIIGKAIKNMSIKSTDDEYNVNKIINDEKGFVALLSFEYPE